MSMQGTCAQNSMEWQTSAVPYKYVRGPVAEHGLVDPKVPGSIPRNSCLVPNFFRYALVHYHIPSCCLFVRRMTCGAMVYVGAHSVGLSICPISRVVHLPE